MLDTGIDIFTFESQRVTDYMQKVSRKSHRKGITFLEIAYMFSTNEKVWKWIEERRWPYGPHERDGILWSMLMCDYQGIYHKMSPKHLDKYFSEFTHRNNIRRQDTIDQMGKVLCGMAGKRLTIDPLFADSGLAIGARS